jgi:iron complex outermembrane recepter protein
MPILSEWFAPVVCVLRVCGIFSLVAAAVQAQESGKRSFDLPSDLAAKTFKLFSEQSGRGMIADADLVRDVRTNSVKGEFSPSDAAGRMLASTGFVAREDPKNGAFVVYRESPDPNVRRAVHPPGSNRPAR